MQTEDFIRLSELLERAVHKYTQLESRAWDYGNGVVLSRPEMHSIMVIGSKPGISVTALAKTRGITKGAASQLLYKLANKGIVEKRVSPDSDAQINLYLTKLGREAEKLHMEYHQKNSEPIFKYLREIPQETTDSLLEIMEYFDMALGKRLENRAVEKKDE